MSDFTNNPKNKLQEYCQSRGKELPKYRVISHIVSPGNTHSWICEVILPDGTIYTGDSMNTKKNQN